MKTSSSRVQLPTIAAAVLLTITLATREAGAFQPTAPFIHPNIAITSDTPFIDYSPLIKLHHNKMRAKYAFHAAVTTELLRILSDDENASAALAVNTEIHLASFGEQYTEGQSGIAYDPDLLPIVVSLLSSRAVTGHSTHSLSAAFTAGLFPNVPEGSVSMAIYSGRISSGPESVGFLVKLDMDALGVASCGNTPFCTFVAYSPIALVDPTGPLPGAKLAELVAGFINGDFASDGSFNAWIEQEWQAIGINWTPAPVSSGAPGASGGCMDDFLECAQGAVNGYGDALDSIDANQGQDLRDAQQAAGVLAGQLGKSMAEAAGIGGKTGVAGTPGGPGPKMKGGVVGTAASLFYKMISNHFTHGDEIDAKVQATKDAQAALDAALCGALSNLGAEWADCAEDCAGAEFLVEDALETLTNESGC